jgi:hypothetical protein
MRIHAAGERGEQYDVPPGGFLPLALFLGGLVLPLALWPIIDGGKAFHRTNAASGKT